MIKLINMMVFTLSCSMLVCLWFVDLNNNESDIVASTAAVSAYDIPVRVDGGVLYVEDKP
jgi:hypothetical protein